jgi:hypothetical protein
MEAEIGEFQNIVDKWFERWLAMIGWDGLTNYIHMVWHQGISHSTWENGGFYTSLARKAGRPLIHWSRVFTFVRPNEVEMVVSHQMIQTHVLSLLPIGCSKSCIFFLGITWQLIFQHMVPM